MCTEPATAGEVRAAMPHPVAGGAADPIALEPVNDVAVTTLVDNTRQVAGVFPVARAHSSAR